MPSSKKILSFASGVFSVFMLVYIVSAFFVPDGANSAALLRICTATGYCGVCDIVATFVTLGKWLIAGASGLALIMIVWGAITFITAQGNPEKIGEGKKFITGAILGLGIAFFAFELVSLIIYFLAVPSTQQWADDPNVSAPRASLSDVLGIPWWQICSEDDLRDAYVSDEDITKGSNSTANCRYWGDGNPCSPLTKGTSLTIKSPVSMCYKGECVSPPVSMCYKGECVSPSENKKLINAEADKKTKQPVLNPRTGLPINFNNPCDYLAVVDPVYEGYKCREQSECSPNKTESGLCPGKTSLCCATGSGVYGFEGEKPVNSAVEAKVREELKNAGIGINNPNSCGDLAYQTYLSTYSAPCTSVAGLPNNIIDKLKGAVKTGACANYELSNPGQKCIVITGGAEKGHATHGVGKNVVDLSVQNGRFSFVKQALEAVGIYKSQDTSGFGNGYTCEESNGAAGNCSSVPHHIHIDID